jgi:hypothetical protein
MERWRGLAQDLLPWAALAAFTGVAVVGDVGPDMRELLLKWGPGLLIFLVIVQHVPTFVRASQRQADAMMAMARQLEELPRRDEFKFQDLMIGQELMLRKLADIEKRLADGGRAG